MFDASDHLKRYRIYKVSRLAYFSSRVVYKNLLYFRLAIRVKLQKLIKLSTVVVSCYVEILRTVYGTINLG